jgi:hypothetical protein
MRLRTLSLQFQATAGEDEPFSDHDLRALAAALVSIAALPLLESFRLSAVQASRCCLLPLVHAPELHSLELELSEAALESDTVLDALRHMPHLRALTCGLSPVALTRMLQPPHTMQIELFHSAGTAHEVPFTDEHGEAIVHLPSLTEFHFHLSSAHTDFLCQLPNLRCLVWDNGASAVDPDVDRIMRSLHSLTRLTDLRISENDRFPLDLTAAHLSACLPHMPLLTILSLSNATALDSLRFLSTGPITRSLQTLALYHCSQRLPLRELAHVHALSSLIQLTLVCSFDRPLDEQTKLLYTPPSVRMPALRDFYYIWSPQSPVDSAEED